MSKTYPNVVVGDDCQHAQIMSGEGVELLDVEAGAAVAVAIDDQSAGIREGGADGIAPALLSGSISAALLLKR